MTDFKAGDEVWWFETKDYEWHGPISGDDLILYSEKYKNLSHSFFIKTNCIGKSKSEAINAWSSYAMNHIELNDLMVCAFRYALGRRTYIAHTISELLIKHKDILSEGAKIGIVRDINRALQSNNYGMDMDKECWVKLRNVLD